MAPQYLSPVFRYDNAARVAILAFRDGSTGEVTEQIPPERVVAEYRRNGGKSGFGVGHAAGSPVHSGPVNSGPVAPGGSSPGERTGASGSDGTGTAGPVAQTQVAQAVAQPSVASAPALALPSGTGFSGGTGGRIVSLSV